MTKILIIEDELILREEVVEWLNFEGYETLAAEDGVIGWQQAQSHHPDLILCDIMMPRLDGYGVLLEVRANPNTLDIPFIFLTAKASLDDMREGMILGADDYITKPFTRQQVLRAIQARLEKKAMQEHTYQDTVRQLHQALLQEHEHRLFKSKLIAMFAHDFGNPLAAILASNSLLRDYADRMDDTRRRTHANRIEASVKLLLQMLDDLLVISKIEAGHFELKLEQCRVSDFFRAMVEEFQAIHTETHQIHFESQFEDTVLTDPRLLQQIGVNLISNAVKYSPKSREVFVTLERQDNLFVLSVADQGIGIPEKDQARLFEAFQRGSNVGAINGTGLGLAIVKQAVEAHKGSIQLESKVGAGTTIRASIPIQF